jgi:assimilatory nitrate reductase catalytic subunit
MGGREVGGLATTLAAHRDLTDPAHRAEMAFLWGSDRIPSKPGLTAVELFEAVREGA